VYRLLIPYYDRQRTVFQLKEAALAATMSEALGLDNRTSLVAIKLKGWKRDQELKHQGNFSKVAQEVRAVWPALPCFGAQPGPGVGVVSLHRDLVVTRDP
jgi:hypothetical protein